MHPCTVSRPIKIETVIDVFVIQAKHLKTKLHLLDYLRIYCGFVADFL